MAFGADFLSRAHLEVSSNSAIRCLVFKLNITDTVSSAAAASNGNSIVAVGANSTAAANGTAVAGTAANSTASDTGKKTKVTQKVSHVEDKYTNR